MATNKTKGGLAVAAIVSAGAVAYSVGGGQTVQLSEEDLLVVRRDSISYSSLQRYYPIEDKVATIYKSKRDRISSFEISPSHSSIALIETKERKLNDDGNGISSVNNMVVVDGNGKTLWKSYDDVRKISYRPDGMALGYITGKFEETERGFTPEKAYVLLFPTGKNKKFVKKEISNLESPTDLSWTEEEGNFYLYLKNHGFEERSKVSRSKDGLASLEPTELTNVNLSGDGKFILLSAAETIRSGECQPRTQDDCLRIAELGSKKKITKMSKLPSGKVPVRWLKNNSNQLLLRDRFEAQQGSSKKGRRNKEVRIPSSRTSKKISVYSAGEKQDVDRFEGVQSEKLNAWRSSESELLVDKKKRSESTPKLLMRRDLKKSVTDQSSIKSLELELGRKIQAAPNSLLGTSDLKGEKLIDQCKKLCQDNAKCSSFDIETSKDKKAQCSLFDTQSTSSEIIKTRKIKGHVHSTKK